MTIVNIHEAKTHLSKLIQQVLHGEEVIIAKSGIPLIKLTPYKKKQPGERGATQRDLAYRR